MMMPDVNVLLIDFQAPGKEMVISNEDGSYTILINARLSHDGQLRAYQHAMKHIHNGDFEKTDIQEIECRAHESEPSQRIAPIPVDRYAKRIQQLQRERKKNRKALKEKEAEIDMIAELYGPDCFMRAAKNNWLYDDSE